MVKRKMLVRNSQTRDQPAPVTAGEAVNLPLEPGSKPNGLEAPSLLERNHHLQGKAADEQGSMEEQTAAQEKPK